VGLGAFLSAKFLSIKEREVSVNQISVSAIGMTERIFNAIQQILPALSQVITPLETKSKSPMTRFQSLQCMQSVSPTLSVITAEFMCI
jgi:hypothetical protein